MGTICYCCYQQQIHTNESRLKLLQNKIQKSYQTKNDGNFTYFYRMFHQHSFLERVLKRYKTHAENKSEENQQFQINKDELNEQFKQLTKYMDDYKNQDSQLRKKMKKDWVKIEDQMKMYTNVTEIMEFACMIKLQIQSLQLIKGISRIGIVRQFKKNQDKNQEEYILLNRIKSEMIYRQFIFPNASGSKIKLITDPFSASITIDVEDLVRQEIICDIFTFKSKSQQFGFASLRMQYVTKNVGFLKEKQYRLNILEKELKCCVSGKDGFDRLSEYKSSTVSNKNTFLSSEMSEYNNEYKI